MNLFVQNWILYLRNDWYGALLRLTILLLPWQTRLFIEGPKMGGFVWEQGRWSLYATMILMGGVVLLSSSLRLPREGGDPSDRSGQRTRRGWVPAFAGMTMVGVIALLFPTLSLTATLQGFLQVVLLIGFGWAVISNHKLRPHLPFWIVLSLIPVALFSLVQTTIQFVPAIKWLGVALQDPSVRGVSVIEVGTERFLRAYGSFPHPNILGGWMMLAALISLREWMRQTTKPFFWFVSYMLFCAMLYLSFSRSAWLAFFGGLFVMGIVSLKDRNGKKLALAMLVSALVIGTAIMIKPELIITRITSQQRLEVKSVNERTASIKQSIGVIKKYPFGTGFAAYRVGLERVCAPDRCLASAEPPHLLPLLVLAELGYIRIFCVLLGIIWFIRRDRKWRNLDVSVLFPLVILMSFDHYLWSLWAGQSLLLVAWFLTKELYFDVNSPREGSMD